MKRCAVYYRVSTTEQTTENQRLAVRSYAERQGWKIVKEYEDAGVSGAAHDRKALGRLRADCAKGRFDVVVVWKFDRMARSTAHLLETLALFQRHGVDFVSVTEAVDTTTPAGRMLMVLVGAFAEFERDVCRERVKAGVARAQAAGTHCGRPRKGFDVAKAMALRAQGWGWRRVAKNVGVSYGTVRRTLLAVTEGTAVTA